MVRAHRAIVAFLVVGLLTDGAWSQPPEGADPALAPWFQSLQTSGGGSCCSQADCRPVEARLTEQAQWEVLIGPQYHDFPGGPPFWVQVMPNRILNKTDNPLGRPVACWRSMQGVLCFVRPPET
jgi:hypothetical protein